MRKRSALDLQCRHGNVLYIIRIELHYLRHPSDFQIKRWIAWSLVVLCLRTVQVEHNLFTYHTINYPVIRKMWISLSVTIRNYWTAILILV